MYHDSALIAEDQVLNQLPDFRLQNKKDNLQSEEGLGRKSGKDRYSSQK